MGKNEENLRNGEKGKTRSYRLRKCKRSKNKE